MEELANKFTLEHLKTYNMEGGVPVAPEGRDSSYALFGDKYSNFNAGKILLILEGIGGISFKKVLCQKVKVLSRLKILAGG